MGVPEDANMKAPRGFSFSLWGLSLFGFFQMPLDKINSFLNFFVPKSKKEERNMMDKKSWLLIILALLGLAGCATLEYGVKGPSIPNDINIIPPSPTLPKEIAVFSGKWAGTWDNDLSAIMVVEEIHDTWGQIVYAYGDLPRSDISAGYKRLKFEVIASPKPKIQFISPGFRYASTIIFEVMDSNTLEGNMGFQTATGSTGNRKVMMKRTN
jgi:hypothetical protein